MSEYRYHHFTAPLLAEDLAFTGGVRPGEPFPAFDLPTVDGRRATSDDMIGTRPVFVYFASVT